eukprot:TRINITY_DN96000_c0_g1_i1.p1 TRINITY_DN96000_c0_g1~~TRINITY_DN96000_c0_g1_i1.p1  ORF type:complete len:436 (+),score=93.69 TRINITY_DN96000_c0_g1_i1:88-1308(+)
MGQQCSCNYASVKEELQEATKGSEVAVDEISDCNQAVASESNEILDALQKPGLELLESAPSAASTQAPSTPTPVSSVAVFEDDEDTEVTPENVSKLCRQGKIVEAMEGLTLLERRAKSKQSSLAEALSSPELLRLREIRDRRDSFLTRLVQPAWKAGETWAVIELEDPQISPDFKLVMRIRLARGKERSSTAGGSQLIIGTRCEGFPLPLTKFIALHSRTHLLRKEWIKDCEKLVGKPAHAGNAYTALLVSMLSPKMLPFRLEDIIMRNFIIHSEAPPQIENSRPGIMVMESSPSSELSHYDGVELPKSRRGVLQITGSEKLNYFMPNRKNKEAVDVISSVRIFLPMPEWLLSLELVKRFLADMFANTLRNIKERVICQWDTLEYDQEIANDPAFFSQLQEIIDTS